MRAGALRNIITIEQRTSNGTNELNEPVYTWSTWRTVFCEKVARRGAEFFDAGTKQRYTQVVYRFRCRYSDVDGLDPANMRIDHEGQKFDIRAPLPDDQRREDVILDATSQDGTV